MCQKKKENTYPNSQTLKETFYIKSVRILTQKKKKKKNRILLNHRHDRLTTHHVFSVIALFVERHEGQVVKLMILILFIGFQFLYFIFPLKKQKV